MKKIRSKLFFILFASLCGFTKGFAYDFEIKQPDLIDMTNYQHLFLDKSMYFNITSASDAEQKTCEVTYKSFEVVENDTVYNIGNADYSQWLSFPEYAEYNGEKYKVIGIGDHAFQDCAELLSVEFNADLDYIGQEAFKNCRSLDNLNYYLVLKEVRERAFQNCVKLHRFYFEATSHVSSKAFNGCTGLKYIYIDEYFNKGWSKYVTADDDAFDIVDGKIDCKLSYPGYGDPDIFKYYTETAPWKYFKEIEYMIDVPGEGTDAIAPVTTSPVGDSRIYTIDGRAVDGAKSLDQLPKGIYICGGKKVIR